MRIHEGNILIVDDDADVLFSARLLLKDHFRKVQTVTDPELLPGLLRAGNYDLVLLDMNYSGSDTSGKDGLYWLSRIVQQSAPPVVVMMTAFGTFDLAVKAIKQGAADFVVKPWENEKLLSTVTSALELRHPEQKIFSSAIGTQKPVAGNTGKVFGEFVGNSPAMRAVYDVIEKIARTDANVLILGENGTGKELAARSIHRQSLRAGKTLVSVDLGAINEHLFESELFGHVKGAFTDAREDRVGRFEGASGSTLFLDEIGNIPFTLQAKLLTALQSRTITRIGANKVIPIDIRLICATNTPIYEKVESGSFREDLLYRIKTIELHLPPLRERGGDIALLAACFIDSYCKRYRKQVMKLSAETLKKLEDHPWPGNVRELQHTIERAVILSDARILKPQDFVLQDNSRRQLAKDTMKLDDIESITIRRALEKNEYNITKAAKELGLSRAALYRKIEKYDIR